MAWSSRGDSHLQFVSPIQAGSVTDRSTQPEKRSYFTGLTSLTLPARTMQSRNQPPLTVRDRARLYSQLKKQAITINHARCVCKIWYRANLYRTWQLTLKLSPIIFSLISHPKTAFRIFFRRTFFIGTSFALEVFRSQQVAGCGWLNRSLKNSWSAVGSHGQHCPQTVCG